jgi:hypothetical protein
MAARNRKINPAWETDEPAREAPRMCSVSGKRMYASEHEAAATAAHRMADKESAAPQLRTYKCLYCGAWHLTSKKM